MSADTKLFAECLDTFKKLSNWVDPNYYRVNVAPTVQKLRERLAVIETNRYLGEKPKTHSYYEKKQSHDDGPPTVPDNLEKIVTGFGLFNDDEK